MLVLVPGVHLNHGSSDHALPRIIALIGVWPSETSIEPRVWALPLPKIQHVQSNFDVGNPYTCHNSPFLNSFHRDEQAKQSFSQHFYNLHRAEGRGACIRSDCLGPWQLGAYITTHFYRHTDKHTHRHIQSPHAEISTVSAEYITAKFHLVDLAGIFDDPQS